MTISKLENITQKILQSILDLITQIIAKIS